MAVAVRPNGATGNNFAARSTSAKKAWHTRGLMVDLSTKVTEIAGEVERLRSESPQVDVGRIVELVKAELPIQAPSEITVKLPDGTVNKVEGQTHPKFERAVRLAGARRNILLVGPAGSGKSHMARQVAEALGLPFYFLSCSAGMSEGQLLGRLIPIGAKGSFEYVRADFVKAYEEGGVFLLDELDAADANVLLVLNAAIANGHMAVPNRTDNPVAKRHPDFVLIAAANTYGTGADRQYVGRNQLDESTLDRFRIGQIEMDYDERLEAALCPDAELRSTLQEYRRKIVAARLRRIISTRFLADAFVMLQCGDALADIETALFSGWSADEVAKVKS